MTSLSIKSERYITREREKENLLVNARQIFSTLCVLFRVGPARHRIAACVHEDRTSFFEIWVSPVSHLKQHVLMIPKVHSTRVLYCLVSPLLLVPYRLSRFFALVS